MLRVKRLYILLLALILLLPCWAAASSEAELTVHTPEALPKAGESFSVTVELTGNPGFSSLQFTLSFDKKALTCTDASTGSLLKGFLSATNPNASDGAIIAAASVSPTEGDGAVGTFTFKANTDLTDWPFALKNVVLSDEAGQDIPYTVSGAKEEATPSTPATPEQPGTSTGSQPSNPPAPATEDTPTAPISAGESTAETSFRDMTGHWSEGFVAKAVERGLFNGFEDGTFRPDKDMTRAEFVTVLYRMAGEPEGAEEPPFTDVPTGQWFSDAVAWAFEKGYVNGDTATTFDPNGTLTRQAAMKILFLYSGGQSGMEMMFTQIYDEHYTDSGKIADWGRAGMYWGVYNSIISGTSDTTLSPNGHATRGQLAKILVGYSEKFA